MQEEINMLKVLIADDEQKVCQLLVNIIDWSAYGFEIVGVVNDGIAAYEFLQNNTVNVVLTDIRMPGCTGMELIQKASLLYKNIHFVIISGYSQFDYAQQAIRYDVEDYLLKPIRKKDLVYTLGKIADKFKLQVQDTQKWEGIEKLLKQSKDKVKQEVLEDILLRPEKFGGFFVREKINEEYGYHFMDEFYQTVMIKVIPCNNRDDMDTRRLLLKRALEILEDLTKGMCKEIVLGIVNEEICGIFNGAEKELDLLPRKLKKLKIELAPLQEVFSEIKVYLALGTRIKEIKEIMVSFQGAKDAMLERFYRGEDILVCPEAMEVTAKKLVDNTFKKRFLHDIEIMNIEGMVRAVHELQELLQKQTPQNGKMVVEVYKEILAVFYFGTHSYNIVVANQYTELVLRLERLGTIEEVFTNLSVYISKVLNNWLEEKQYVESKPIRMAKHYIGEYYYQSLTLEVVSKEIGFNPTYFSTMFKKETGKNFSEYLKEVRIENAKTMLLNTEQSVEDISYAIGYLDIKYFSRLFKKLTGITPTEFRKLYN